MDKVELGDMLHKLHQLQKDEVDNNKKLGVDYRIATALEKIEVVLEFIALIGMQLLTEELNGVPSSNDQMDLF